MQRTASSFCFDFIFYEEDKAMPQEIRREKYNEIRFLNKS